jgi:hypothetical protein
MRGQALAVLIVAGLAAGPAARGAEKTATGRGEGAAALARLKGLAGEWRGHILTPDGPPVTVVYSVTGGGSTVEEKLFPGTEHEMVSMYYLDGVDLVLTHYCAGGNQPRMKQVPSSDATELRFDFTGGANIDPARTPHMHGGRLFFRGPDRLDTEWANWENGKQSGAHKFFLERVKVAAEAR